MLSSPHTSQIILFAADEDAVSGIQRFLTRPVIAVAIVIGCFILTRITYAILRSVVRKVADSKPGRGKSWWKNTMRRVGAETLEGGENRRRQRIEAATGKEIPKVSFEVGEEVAARFPSERIDRIPRPHIDLIAANRRQLASAGICSCFLSRTVPSPPTSSKTGALR